MRNSMDGTVRHGAFGVGGSYYLSPLAAETRRAPKLKMPSQKQCPFSCLARIKTETLKYRYARSHSNEIL